MSVNGDSRVCSDLQNEAFSSPELGRVAVDTDRESGGSAAERIWKERIVHNQVMRIREEDLLIGEDVADGLEKAGGRILHVASPVFFSRPILPCSPLSGKAARCQGIALN